jgi:hypothetical protein
VATVRGFCASQYAKKRRFSAAIGSDQTNALSWAYAEGDIIKDGIEVIGFVYVVDG